MKLFSKISRIGWDPVVGEKDLDKMLRAVVLGALGGNGDQRVISEAKHRFQQYLNDNTSLPSDLLGVVIKSVVVNGGEEEYNKVVELFENSTQPENKIKALSGFCSSYSPELIQRTIDYAMAGKVRSQDIMYVFAGISSSPSGRKFAWNYVKDNWEKIKKDFESGGLLLGRIVSYTTKDFSSEEYAQDLENFFRDRKEPGIERTVVQTLESIRSNASFLNKEKESFRHWLRGKNLE